MIYKSIWKLNSATQQFIYPKIINFYIKDYLNKKVTKLVGNEIDINHYNTSLTVLNNTFCQCDYLLEEIHYRIIINKIYFYLLNIEVDIVLNKNIIGKCNMPKILKFKNSLKFQQNSHVYLL